MEPIVLPAGIRQAVSSLEGFFSCTISPFEDQAEPSKRECSSCRISSNRSSVSIPASLCGGRYGFIWSFPEDHPVSAELAEHIQFCSRALIAAMEKPSAGEDNRFFRQVAEILGRGEERGVLILDTQDNTIYQNRTARGRTILKRFLDYQAQSGDASLTSISPVSLLLEGSAPVRISLHNLYCGNRFSGRLVIAEPAGSLPIEKKEGRRHILRGFNGTIGSNRLLVKSIAIARKAAATESTILLRGESGTGKEKFARAIHDLSNRRGFPFAAINCAAIPESLLESELFGYEGGSFTGAKTDGKAGKIEAAHHGTIFLDEIGDMPQTLQAKLLRVLQDREFERVGSTKPVSVDVRFISATHQNLETLMEEGRFRKDLFYRLNVIPLFIPPLRERKDDIAYLLSYFLKKYVIQNPRSGFKYFSYEAKKILKAWSWPGNIRELDNVVQYCMTITSGEEIFPEDLPPYLLSGEPGASEGSQTAEFVSERKDAKYTKDELARLLSLFGTSTDAKRQIAARLEISLATLYRHLRAQGLAGRI